MGNKGLVQNRILKDYLILCEGIDEVNFLITYLNSDELKYNERFSNDIQVFDFGGINMLSSYLKNFVKLDGFNKVKRLMIIRDAEKNYDSAISNIRSALDNNGFEAPKDVSIWSGENIKIGYLLFPECSSIKSNGTLEDMCLRIINEERFERIDKEIDIFLDGLEDKEYRLLNHRFKSKLHTYFSVTDNYIGSKVGEAAKRGAFNWNSDYLVGLRSFIEEGFEGL
ncbi:MAG: hypothetical protein IJ065_07845 [Eubacterium sp.]|nr:hypothetical protein [Eubacterium sp.]